MRRLTTRRASWCNIALAVVLVGARRLEAAAGRRTTYTADFANASGISAGDDVRVAGIDVGKVTGVRLERGVVHVEFTAEKGVAVARTARAEIKLATILGQHYLDLVPGKGDRLDGGGTIPLAQTKSAYTIDKFQVDANDAVQTPRREGPRHGGRHADAQPRRRPRRQPGGAEGDRTGLARRWRAATTSCAG